MIADLKPYPEYKESGLPWLGQVPKHWVLGPGFATFRKKKVKNTGMQEKTVLSLSYGRIVVKPPENLHGLVPDSFETYQIVDDGDIIIRSTDLQNDWNSLRVGLVRNRGIITSAYLCFRTTDKLIPEYGYHLLHTFDLLKIFYGLGSGLRQNLDWADFKRMLIFIPPPDEQAAIVRFLDWATGRLTRAIRAKRKMVSLLNEQKQAIIHRAVTRGLDPSVSLKPSGIPWLGDIPAHWEVRRLKSLCRFVTSGSRGWARYYADAGSVFLRIGNISTTSVELRLNRITYVKPPTDAEGERTRVLPDDILLSITAQIGAVGVVPEGLGEAFVNQHTALIRLRQGESIPRWIAYGLLSQFGKDQCRLMTNGGTKVGLTLDDVLCLVVLLPPTNDQLTIVNGIERETHNLNANISALEREIHLLKEYRTRLVADVVTGKLDVREAAARLPDEAPPEPEEDNGLDMDLEPADEDITV